LSAMTTPRPAPFGTMLTAMVTPFTSRGDLDESGAAELAIHLVDRLGHDGLVINGTTGEAPTTSDEEKQRLLEIVIDAVGDRATILAGVGTYDTAHSIHLSRQAASVGAHGLLVVSPYYNRPPQAGLLAHFTAVADATELPVVTYDIPKRTGVSIEPDTLVRLAEHPRIVANKDAKGDLDAAQQVLARCDLAWYSGDDILNLPLLSIGASGFISVVGHVVGDRLGELVRTYLAGDTEGARLLNRSLLPVYQGIFRTQGVILVKAALTHLGLPGGPVRSPLVDATPEQVEQLRADLAAAGVENFSVDAA
jgi:4-hydroxy-tetrahydrodipicolinate synthase